MSAALMGALLRWSPLEDLGLMPYTMVRADNGDAWVEVSGKRLAPPIFQPKWGAR